MTQWFSRVLTMVTILAVSAAQNGSRVYISPNGEFQFKYPKSLVVCGEGDDGPNHPCSTYMPICSQDSLVCLAYPATGHEKATFQGAAFSVSVLKKRKTEKECLKIIDPNACWSSSAEKHNGLRFETDSCGGAGSNHSLDENDYRTFHQGKCYEPNISLTESQLVDDAAVPLKGFKSFPHILRQLREPLKTFRFRTN